MPLLQLVELGDTGKKEAKNVSLGMRKRLGIAVALAGDPDFLVLDEPVNGDLLSKNATACIGRQIEEGEKMSQIVVFMGSPRKNRNTARLVSAFCAGAEQKHEIEVFHVADMQIHPCIGCNSCMQREGNTCFQKDDMEQIYQALMSADILVIATPVYFYGVSAQLKAVIDRLHTPMRSRFGIRKMVLLSAAAATIPNVFDSIKLQFQMVVDYFHLENTGMVLMKGVKDPGESEGCTELQEAYELGMNL